MKLKNRGFTLVELMISVGIVAFLAEATFSSFKSMQAKARRTEAFIQLSASHQAMSIYFNEFNSYTACLCSLGVFSCNFTDAGQEAQRRYTVGFDANVAGTEVCTDCVSYPGTLPNPDWPICGGAFGTCPQNIPGTITVSRNNNYTEAYPPTAQPCSGGNAMTGAYIPRFIWDAAGGQYGDSEQFSTNALEETGNNFDFNSSSFVIGAAGMPYQAPVLQDLMNSGSQAEAMRKLDTLSIDQNKNIQVVEPCLSDATCETNL